MSYQSDQRGRPSVASRQEGTRGSRTSIELKGESPGPLPPQQSTSSATKRRRNGSAKAPLPTPHTTQFSLPPNPARAQTSVSPASTVRPRRSSARARHGTPSSLDSQDEVQLHTGRPKGQAGRDERGNLLPPLYHKDGDARMRGYKLALLEIDRDDVTNLFKIRKTLDWACSVAEQAISLEEQKRMARYSEEIVRDGDEKTLPFSFFAQEPERFMRTPYAVPVPSAPPVSEDTAFREFRRKRHILTDPQSNKVAHQQRKIMASYAQKLIDRVRRLKDKTGADMEQGSVLSFPRSLIDESEPSYDGEYLPTLRSSRYVRMQRKLLEYEQAQSPGSAPPTLIDYLKPHIQDYVDMWLGGPQNPEFDLEVEISYREIDKKVQEDEDQQPPPAPEPTPVLSGDANSPIRPQSAESLSSSRFESERLVFRAAGEKEIDRSLSPLVRQECDARTLKANPSVETQSASDVATPRVHANHSSTGEGEEVGVKRGHEGRPSSKKRWMSDDSLKIRKQGGAVITVNDLGMRVLPTTVVVDTKKKRKRDEEVDGVASKRIRTTRHFVHLDPIPHAERPEFPYDLTAHIIPPPAPPRNELTSENVFELKERHLGPYTITGSRDGLQSWDEENNDGTYLERDLGYAPSSGYRGRRTVLDEDELIAAARADPEHPFPNGVPRCYADQARKPMDAKMNDWLTNYTYPKATPEQMVGALLPPAYPNWSFVYDYELNYEIVRAPTPRKKYF